MFVYYLSFHWLQKRDLLSKFAYILHCFNKTGILLNILCILIFYSVSASFQIFFFRFKYWHGSQKFHSAIKQQQQKTGTLMSENVLFLGDKKMWPTLDSSFSQVVLYSLRSFSSFSVFVFMASSSACSTRVQQSSQCWTVTLWIELTSHS